jgi:hypothetical protein
VDYLNYCRNLEFEETPNYAYLRKLFRQLYRRHFDKYDFEYDWKNPQLLKEREISKADAEEEEREKHLAEKVRISSTKKGTDDLHHTFGREKSFATTRGGDIKSDRSPLEKKREKHSDARQTEKVASTKHRSHRH